MERGSVLDDVIERATEGRGCSSVQSHCLTYGQIHHPLFHGYFHRSISVCMLELERWRGGVY